MRWGQVGPGGIRWAQWDKTVVLVLCWWRSLSATPSHKKKPAAVLGPWPPELFCSLFGLTAWWWLAVRSGGCWWVLVGAGGCWWVLVGAGGCWWVLVDVLMVLTRFSSPMNNCFSLSSTTRRDASHSVA